MHAQSTLLKYLTQHVYLEATHTQAYTHTRTHILYHYYSYNIIVLIYIYKTIIANLKKTLENKKRQKDDEIWMSE